MTNEEKLRFEIFIADLAENEHIKTAEAAGRWIDRHSYEGMNHYYEIVRVK